VRYVFENQPKMIFVPSGLVIAAHFLSGRSATHHQPLPEMAIRYASNDFFVISLAIAKLVFCAVRMFKPYLEVVPQIWTRR
jgi:hypothetical protein